MIPPGNGGEKCLVKGRVIYPTRREACAARDILAARYGTAKAYRCIFGDHYHVTKGARARKRKRS